jgi:hypothetical protein
MTGAAIRLFYGGIICRGHMAASNAVDVPRAKVAGTWSHRLIVHLRILKDLYLLSCPSWEWVSILAKVANVPQGGQLFCDHLVSIFGNVRI